MAEGHRWARGARLCMPCLCCAVQLSVQRLCAQGSVHRGGSAACLESSCLPLRLTSLSQAPPSRPPPAERIPSSHNACSSRQVSAALQRLWQRGAPPQVAPQSPAHSQPAAWHRLPFSLWESKPVASLARGVPYACTPNCPSSMRAARAAGRPPLPARSPSAAPTPPPAAPGPTRTPRPETTRDLWLGAWCA